MYKSMWSNKVLCEREAGQMNPGLLKKDSLNWALIWTTVQAVFSTSVWKSYRWLTVTLKENPQPQDSPLQNKDYCTKTASTGFTVSLANFELHDFILGNSWHVFELVSWELKLLIIAPTRNVINM